MVFWMVQLTQQPIYVWGCMSSPGKQHVTSEESTDNRKIYGRAVCCVHKELISHTGKKLNFLAATDVTPNWEWKLWYCLGDIRDSGVVVIDKIQHWWNGDWQPIPHGALLWTDPTLVILSLHWEKKHKWKRTYMLEMNNVTSSGGT